MFSNDARNGTHSVSVERWQCVSSLMKSKRRRRNSFAGEYSTSKYSFVVVAVTVTVHSRCEFIDHPSNFPLLLFFNISFSTLHFRTHTSSASPSFCHNTYGIYHLQVYIFTQHTYHSHRHIHTQCIYGASTPLLLLRQRKREK